MRGITIRRTGIMFKRIRIILPAMIIMALLSQLPATMAYAAQSVSVVYSVHGQGYGWQAEKSNGAAAGTSGQSRRVEAVKARITEISGLSIAYRSHVQGIGWETSWRLNGNVSGTTGASKRLEAFQMKLAGARSGSYDIYYCAHVQDYGWLGWAKNGTTAGTAGLSKRIEAIRVLVLAKGSMPPKQAGKYSSPAIYKQLEVTFNGNGASASTFGTQVFKCGVAGQKFAGTITRKGYTMLGWSTSRTASSAKYGTYQAVGDSFINSCTGGKLTLYAVWQKDKVLKTETIKCTSSSAKNADRYAITNNNHFEIQYFCGPGTSMSDKMMDAITEAGFTIAPNWDIAGYGDDMSAKNMDSFLKKLKAHNLKAYLRSQVGERILNLDGLDSNKKVKTSTGNSSVDTNYAKTKQALKNPVILGLDLIDEPSLPTMVKSPLYQAGVIDVANAVKQWSGKSPYINIFPSYAKGLFDVGDDYYRDYVLYWALNTKGIDVLSVDFYPSLKSYSAKNRAAYYQNLVYLLEACKEVKKQQGRTIIPMNIVALHTLHITPSKKSHIMYQVNTNLAFGMKRLSYFTFSYPAGETWAEGWLVNNSDGTSRTTQYGYVKAINRWAFNIGCLLYNKDISAIYRFSGGKATTLYKGASYSASCEYTKLLGDVACKKDSSAASGNAEGVITVFTDGTCMLLNGEPESSTVFTVPQLSKKQYYSPCSGTFANPRAGYSTTVTDGQGTTLFTVATDAGQVTLPGGGAVILK